MQRNIQLYEAVFVLALGLLSLANGEQYEGVKAGRYQQRYSQPANETGFCYKRLPYAEAVQLNTTGHVHVVHNAGSQQGVKTNRRGGGWVTIIDCCEGYVRDEATGDCTVQCEGGCFGGVCAPGGICTCESGWYAENGVCKPICRRACQRDAYCFAPDVCACKYGYEESVDGQCLPICTGGCENGDCIAFQTCRCKPGYVMNGNNKCEAVCEGGCPHGECTRPGVCTCYSGYVNPPGETEACLPDCGPSGCLNGDCTSPGVCTCSPGYIQDYQTRKCVPDCPRGCPENARCMAPNRCGCNPGFVLDQHTRTCVNPQTHQTDSSPYQRPDSQQAQCDRPCMNGQCTGWNVCTCNSGYMPDPRDPTRTRCVPGCPGGCPNGVCSGPNFCICKPGYVKDRSVKGSQQCIPREITMEQYR
ncbi:von Willebrand factor D and EGF domain-containing protein-like [Venturia canescens]|uniref:von Willebrand factor D and EGF domain-containing protein-like n=1 Tax=Venturia canescens TaxID=32260 RepID=UPI001C9CF75E|nr:von Willebrand factor D and EGF domain-containing protein-like [Venturia canescens]